MERISPKLPLRSHLDIKVKSFQGNRHLFFRFVCLHQNIPLVKSHISEKEFFVRVMSK